MFFIGYIFVWCFVTQWQWHSLITYSESAASRGRHWTTAQRARRAPMGSERMLEVLNTWEASRAPHHPLHTTQRAAILNTGLQQPKALMTSLWWIKGFCRLEPFVIITATKDLIIHARSDRSSAQSSDASEGTLESGSLKDSLRLSELVQESGSFHLYSCLNL